MILAAVRDDTYNLFLILHILSAVVAYAPVFSHPLVSNQAKQLDASSRGLVMGFMAGNGRRVYAPALLVSGVLGFGLAGLSDEVYKMSDGWLIAAFILWVAMNGVLHAIVIPAERAIATGVDAARNRHDMGNALMSILLVVMLYTMIFKPF